jgi:LPXTG-motif cell wall-anchored protein
MSVVEVNGVEESVTGGPFLNLVVTAPFPTATTTAPNTSSSTAPPLPTTGSTYRIPLYVGLGVFAGGALITLITRRRPSS